MRILAVDTATPSCSVALAEDGEVRAAAVDVSGVTHSRHLMGLVHQVLASAGWRTTQLDGFGVTRGPGSFTGIRIGMSAVMGLAQALGRPIVGVSALEVLAWPLLQGGDSVCALIDARRKEVYCGAYRLSGDTVASLAPEGVAAPMAAIENLTGPYLFVGSGAKLYRQEIEAQKGVDARFAPAFQQHPDAAVVAWLATQRLLTEGVEAGDLRPLYLRQSDAQIHRAAAMKASDGPGSP